MTSSPHIVEIAGVTKRFPGVLALDHIHVGFRAGEVHAVVGENGAGKSTLMHILAGDLQPNEGEILVDGKATHFASPLDSRAAGIVVVYQELALCPTMTIAENVVMSDMARRRVASLVPRAMMRAEARAALERLGMDSLDPDTRVSRLSVAEMQLVEIARAVRQRARVLVLDEPNSALSRRESERLFDVMRQLRAEGVTVIYVSHHLREVLDLADRVTIMRDGRTIETLDNEGLSEQRLIRSMVGRDLGDVPPWRVNPAARSEGNPVVLSVTDLKAPGLAGISFEVRAGEILGVGGLPDSGKDALGEALFGLCPRDGRVAIEGVETPADALASIRCGMAFVPADRRGAGGLLAMTVADNVVSASLKRFSVAGVLQRAAIRREARAQVARLDARICTPWPEARHPFWRQSAEDHSRPQPRHASARAHPARADARHRCRRQGRDLWDTPRDRERRRRDRPDLLGGPGAPHERRARSCLATRADFGRAARRSHDRG